MPLTAGARIGSYEVLGSLGAGGMGEVYRARDTRLDRHVAIKILPETLAGDPDRAARFEREAKTLAALNHPQIAHVYGLEREGSVSALVMELVEGEDLAHRIARGPIPLEETLPIARQIAEALEAAHENGIIHRDLKPANIKVRPDGTVKVLDFGLAKMLAPLQADALSGATGHDLNPLNSPTLTSPLTAHGLILGTAAYMSPEQARGRPVDRRTDIWAFGVLLYEMLTGQRAFPGTDVSETLAAVLRDVPSLEKLPAATPAVVRGLLRRCLDRDPHTRLRDIGEARVILSGGSTGSESVTADAQARSWRVWLALAAGVALGAVIVLVPDRDPGPMPSVRKLPISVPGLDLTQDKPPVISPDGQRIVYSANGSLWVRELSRLEAQSLPNTEGASGMFWSPDNTRIGFIQSGRLRTLTLAGGQPTNVAALPGPPCGEPGGLWESSGRILLSLSCNTFPLFGVSDMGGNLGPVFDVEKPAERDVHQIAALPGTRAVVLALDRANAGVDTLIAWDGTARKTILQIPNERLASPAYSPTGHLLYQRTSTNPGVWAVPFSPDRLEVTGEPFLVAAGMAAPSVSRDGTLLVVPLTGTGENQLAWIDRTGRIDVRIDEVHPRVEEPRLSPDGMRVAFSITGPEGGRNIWIRNLADERRTRLTSGPVLKWRPVWSPDGKYVYYDVEQPGRAGRIERQSSAGGGTPETIVDGGNSAAISPDGRWLVYISGYGPSGRKLMKARLDGDRTPSPLFDTPGRPAYPAVSPDQRFIAYVIEEAGSDDGIYVSRFPDGNGQWHLDTDRRGFRPRWSAKGDRLFFTRGNELWQIDVQLGEQPVFGRPVRLFAGMDNRSWPSNYGFDVAADGRFLLVANVVQTAPPVMTLIDNWFLEFANRR